MAGSIVGGLGGAHYGAIAGYGICSLVFGIPSGGTSLLWCSIVAGIAGGYGGGKILGGLGKDSGEILYDTIYQWYLMETPELIFLILIFLAATAIFLMIVLMFYIGRTRIKEIDKVVYGFEFPNDSIFALGLRVPNYGGAFLWKWSAKRSGLEGKIEHFDKCFRWPFIAVYLLMIFGVFMMILAGVFEKYYMDTE